jgi:hypothetical protein
MVVSWGRITTTGFPIAGFFLAVTTAGVFIFAALAVMEWWDSVWLVEGSGYGRSFHCMGRCERSVAGSRHLGRYKPS